MQFQGFDIPTRKPGGVSFQARVVGGDGRGRTIECSISDEGLAQFDKVPTRRIDVLSVFNEHEAEIHDIAERKIRAGASPVQITGADVQSRPRAGGG
jgi:Protein of unknown function (DUF1488)